MKPQVFSSSYKNIFDVYHVQSMTSAWVFLSTWRIILVYNGKAEIRWNWHYSPTRWMFTDFHKLQIYFRFPWEIQFAWEVLSVSSGKVISWNLCRLQCQIILKRWNKCSVLTAKQQQQQKQINTPQLNLFWRIMQMFGNFFVSKVS